ncbi:MAG: DUF768 domain-containing protein [Mesorhizobium sp.]|uniref:DUF768 domain-containing protein n=1 Tax=Mesorhizobium temperatum TaxID=241416 RepID=A0A271LJT2_9HYPH|nr:hypothetical protein CIT26_21255 [Mesorhizobium temperatum]RWC04291.1 MAG: DUF768 domain-containing protein [Mesorhizobium sp.]RWO92200.1 MAG: DUF768 domain-containing protein [Mesorhizobium sp.]RWP27740.1 MAG: DUF768 domain-containing protein [Mesorhizobium sp.]RWP33518.1 MAG: DUF768 domain-containing protein [Mesorhizobium sp.]
MSTRGTNFLHKWLSSGLPERPSACTKGSIVSSR